MLLKLSSSLHYPITVTELLRQPGDVVSQGDALFAYFYRTTVTEGDGLGNKHDVVRTFPTRFEAAVDGTLMEWKIKAGDVFDAPTTVAEIDEPCSHEVQFGGMCANCGKDMTHATYNSDFLDSSRAPIHIAHDNSALTVSQDEATRVEEDAKRRLLASRRLSLVVDLDQTIIHATVDPTVGEWQQDENNPNYDAVKDVRSFQLVDDGPGMRGCWYYIKLRPGLEEFLRTVSKIYELHIYTMGTRAYAQNIANIVDPDRKIFGDRILSRDESGSLTAKNLQRLFPVDTKMVVIIDDRGDVWKWSDNLVKVSPYDFFVGIGDINSSFLPKKPEMNKGPKQVEKPKKPPVQTDKEPAKQGVNGETSQNGEGPSDAGSSDNKSKTEVSALEQLVTMGGGDNPVLLQEQANEQEEAIAHQVEERPLLQKQKELDAEDEAEESTTTENGESSTEDSDSPRHQRHHLLEDSDTELSKLQERLQMIHSAFFDEYDRKRSISLGGRVSALRGERVPPKDKATELRIVPDIKVIMPSLKRRVMEGVVLVFSGVLPLGTDTLNADISLWTRSFGAIIAQKVNSRTTHLVAGRNRTAKVREATRYPSIHIVTIQWLLDSLVNWTRQDEQSYLVPVHPEDRVDPVDPTEKSQSEGGDGKAEDHGILSSDDEESSTMSDEESDQSGPQVNTDDIEHADEEILQSSGLNEYSPIGYDASEQAEVHDELKAFLGSDDEESESDDSDYPLPPETELGSRKRKRGTTTESDESGAESDRSRDSDSSDVEGEDGSGSGIAAAKGLGSKLSRKIKKSRQRTTGLKEVSTVSSRRQSADDLASSPALDSDRSAAVENANKADEEADESDEYDAELEREMLAAFEDEQDAMEAEPT